MEDTLTQTMTALMLILDVKTWWLSTHQMLRKWALLKILLLMKKYIVIGRAFDYRSVIDDFIAKNKDLRKFEMHVDDWDGIALVAQWLKSFRSTTTQMSTMKQPMLLSTHAIYWGLQELLCESLTNLPNNIPTPTEVRINESPSQAKWLL